MPYRTIPRPDADLSAFANHYSPAAKVWWDKHGLNTDELDPLVAALLTWNERYTAHTAARAAAEAARQEKDSARRALEAQIRPVSAFIQSYPATTNAERAAIGLTVRDLSNTPPAPPTTRPVARIGSGQRMMHTLRFADESTPTRTVKPKGAIGAEVWIAITDAHEPAPPLNMPGPAEAGAYRFITTSSNGGVRATFTGAEAGRTANYVLRWVNTRGERGPWSEVVSATVAA
jgi:hypothetical protein